MRYLIGFFLFGSLFGGGLWAQNNTAPDIFLKKKPGPKISKALFVWGGIGVLALVALASGALFLKRRPPEEELFREDSLHSDLQRECATLQKLKNDEAKYKAQVKHILNIIENNNDNSLDDAITTLKEALEKFTKNNGSFNPIDKALYKNFL